MNCVEAIPIGDLDPDAAKSGFRKVITFQIYSSNNHEQFQEDLAKADSLQAKAAATIGLEVHTALCAALKVSA